MGMFQIAGKLVTAISKFFTGADTMIVDGITKSINKKPEKAVKGLRLAIKLATLKNSKDIFFKKAKLWFKKNILKKKLTKSELAEVNKLINTNDTFKELHKGLKKFQKSDWANALVAKHANYLNELFHEYKEGGAGKVAANIVAKGLTKILSLFSPPPIQLAPTMPMPNKVSADTSKINTRSIGRSLSEPTKIANEGIKNIKSITSKMQDPLLAGAMMSLATTTAKGIQSLANQSASNAMEIAEGTNNVASDLAEKVASSADLNTTNSGIIMGTQDRLLVAANSLAPPITDTANRVATVTPIIGELPRHLQHNAVVTMNAIDELGERLNAGTVSLNDKVYVPLMEATVGGGMVESIVGSLLPTLTKMGEELLSKAEEQGEDTDKVRASLGDYFNSVKDSVKSKVELAKERATQLHETVKEYTGNIAFMLGALYKGIMELPFVKKLIGGITKILKHFNLIGQDKGFESVAMNKADYEAALAKSNSADSYSEKMHYSASAVEMARSHMNYEIDELTKQRDAVDKSKNHAEWKRLDDLITDKKHIRKMMNDLFDNSNVFKVFIEPFKKREYDDDKNPLRIFTHTDEITIYNYFFIPFIAHAVANPNDNKETNKLITSLGIDYYKGVDVATFINGLFNYNLASGKDLVNNWFNDVLSEFDRYVKDVHGAITKEDIAYITNVIYKRLNRKS